jgi:hypothetical protein
MQKILSTTEAARILGRSKSNIRYNIKALGGRKKFGRWEYDADKVYEIAGISEAECQPLSSRL